MAVRSIGYVDLYTKDSASTAQQLVSAFGFTRAGELAGGDRESVVLRQGDVRLLVTSGPATWKFVDAHGDGIADIALVCDDADATRDAALAAGARPLGTLRGHAVVSGFGDVGHTLLPAAPDLAAGPGSAGDRLRLLDHVAVCLEGGTIGEHAEFYIRGFGMSRYSSEYVDVGENAMDSIVVRSESGEVTFTLVAPDPAKGRGQLDAFLSRNSGPGVQHLAFLVEDIIAAVHDLGEHGVQFLSTPDAYYDRLAERFAEMRDEIGSLRRAQVLADRDEWGYLLQLFSRSPYERNTLFYELIQRRGSRGFGSANIRALYEAVEHDREATG
ncbi:4-hydroxyphenylpyruvate dioxygenase [Dactylosporangium vinaceum]|uniref:4-hydroxyphenylpyruvate dioxygenase n=1 Tax=Dactylosporangium vinaceum TaxID=53362 RepID=A0ABV5MSZ6_9ACTN|nr:4-hydroxyphenylpyruvate dioxygenase [Dactylosporangium vinaceum]UAB99902.1 4-hydroxyphenylpyruvate dioxygenase [Dactylosporangium vinaceum]